MFPELWISFFMLGIFSGLTGKNASLHVDINPHSPLTLPDCRFLGADYSQYCCIVFGSLIQFYHSSLQQLIIISNNQVA